MSTIGKEVEQATSRQEVNMGLLRKITIENKKGQEVR